VGHLYALVYESQVNKCLEGKLAKQKVEFMGVQQNLLSATGLDLAVLEYVCRESNNLYNSTMFEARKVFFDL
jgi:hypothetical protein